MDRAELGRLLNLREEFVTSDRPNYRDVPIAPTYLTVHNTSNTSPGADAAAHSRFVRQTGYYTLASGKQNFVSWHYTVDDQCLIKHLPINRLALHAGAGNAKSIGIEICMHKNIDQKAANLRAARLAAALLHDLRLSNDAVVPHKHWTGKNCPTLLLPSWQGFLNDVHQILVSVSSGKTPLVLESQEIETPAGGPLESLDLISGSDASADIDHDALSAAINQHRE